MMRKGKVERTEHGGMGALILLSVAWLVKESW